MDKKHIIDAYCRIRTNDNSIPDDVLDFMKESALAALSAQSSNTSDIEIEEDLVKQMEDAIALKIEKGSARGIMIFTLSIEETAQICASIAQSFADKQCLELIGWLGKSGFTTTKSNDGSEWSKTFDIKTYAPKRLLTIYKQSK